MTGPMTDKPNLADARRVTEAATRGPWTFSDTTDVRGHKGEFRAPSPDNGFMLVGPWCNDADAEFIAASRKLVPALLAAVDAVLALADRWEHGATRWADPLPVPREVEQVRAAITAHLDIEPR